MRLASTVGGCTALLLVALPLAAPELSGVAAAQSNNFYAGKTLRIIVGLESGGTADVFARGFAVHLKKHIPGNPTIVVQNM